MKNLVVNYESQPVKSNRGSYLLYQLFDSNCFKWFRHRITFQTKPQFSDNFQRLQEKKNRKKMLILAYT